MHHQPPPSRPPRPTRGDEPKPEWPQSARRAAAAASSRAARLAGARRPCGREQAGWDVLATAAAAARGDAAESRCEECRRLPSRRSPIGPRPRPRPRLRPRPASALAPAPAPAPDEARIHIAAGEGCAWHRTLRPACGRRAIVLGRRRGGARLPLRAWVSRARAAASCAALALSHLASPAAFAPPLEEHVRPPAAHTPRGWQLGGVQPRRLERAHQPRRGK